MNIWIIDDDISFAYDLKKKILASRSFPSAKKESKVEVFHDEASFSEALKEARKDQPKLPHLIFLDAQLSDMSGLELYWELLEMDDPILDVIYFCSNISYGRFEKCFEQNEEMVPPLYSKSSFREGTG